MPIKKVKKQKSKKSMASSAASSSAALDMIAAESRSSAAEANGYDDRGQYSQANLNFDGGQDDDDNDGYEYEEVYQPTEADDGTSSKKSKTQSDKNNNKKDKDKKNSKDVKKEGKAPQKPKKKGGFCCCFGGGQKDSQQGETSDKQDNNDGNDKDNDQDDTESDDDSNQDRDQNDNQQNKDLNNGDTDDNDDFNINKQNKSNNNVNGESGQGDDNNQNDDDDKSDGSGFLDADDIRGNKGKGKGKGGKAGKGTNVNEETGSNRGGNNLNNNNINNKQNNLRPVNTDPLHRPNENQKDLTKNDLEFKLELDDNPEAEERRIKFEEERLKRIEKEEKELKSIAMGIKEKVEKDKKRMEAQEYRWRPQQPPTQVQVVGTRNRYAHLIHTRAETLYKSQDQDLYSAVNTKSQNPGPGGDQEDGRESLTSLGGIHIIPKLGTKMKSNEQTKGLKPTDNFKDQQSALHKDMFLSRDTQHGNVGMVLGYGFGLRDSGPQKMDELLGDPYHGGKIVNNEQNNNNNLNINFNRTTQQILDDGDFPQSNPGTQSNGKDNDEDGNIAIRPLSTVNNEQTLTTGTAPTFIGHHNPMFALGQLDEATWLKIAPSAGEYETMLLSEGAAYQPIRSEHYKQITKTAIPEELERETMSKLGDAHVYNPNEVEWSPFNDGAGGRSSLVESKKFNQIMKQNRSSSRKSSSSPKSGNKFGTGSRSQTLQKQSGQSGKKSKNKKDDDSSDSSSSDDDDDGSKKDSNQKSVKLSTIVDVDDETSVTDLLTSDDAVSKVNPITNISQKLTTKDLKNYRSKFDCVPEKIRIVAERSREQLRRQIAAHGITRGPGSTNRNTTAKNRSSDRGSSKFSDDKNNNTAYVTATYYKTFNLLSDDELIVYEDNIEKLTKHIQDNNKKDLDNNSEYSNARSLLNSNLNSDDLYTTTSPFNPKPPPQSTSTPYQIQGDLSSLYPPEVFYATWWEEEARNYTKSLTIADEVFTKAAEAATKRLEGLDDDMHKLSDLENEEIHRLQGLSAEDKLLLDEGESDEGSADSDEGEKITGGEMRRLMGGNMSGKDVSGGLKGTKVGRRVGGF